MEYTDILGLRCSRLAIGTSQFGLLYGISNRTGQPSKAQAREILSVAFDGGVNVIDTAYAYGNSEEVIGEALASLSDLPDLVIATKLKPLSADQSLSPSQLHAEMNESVVTSLKRLRLETVSIYLMHRPEHLTAYSGGIVQELLRLRQQGLVQHVGISVYTPQQADQALGVEGIEAIQVPFNVLDQRLIGSSFFDRAAQKGVAVFIRSVYLKGVLVMDVADLPSYLEQAVPHKQRFKEICARYGRDPVEVALKYPLTLKVGTSVLTGVEQASQMRANLKLFDAPPLADEMLAEIGAAFEDVPEYVLNPALWPQD